MFVIAKKISGILPVIFRNTVEWDLYPEPEIIKKP